MHKKKKENKQNPTSLTNKTRGGYSPQVWWLHHWTCLVTQSCQVSSRFSQAENWGHFSQIWWPPPQTNCLQVVHKAHPLVVSHPSLQPISFCMRTQTDRVTSAVALWSARPRTLKKWGCEENPSGWGLYPATAGVREDESQSSTGCWSHPADGTLRPSPGKQQQMSVKRFLSKQEWINFSI